ncbi:MAG: hypothetical protein D3903_19185 [Candidatus Electrothrix sp. GM3_4]|nr:hypothetical protein [Candidatus Electrothrix sp. GM3_4]
MTKNKVIQAQVAALNTGSTTETLNASRRPRSLLRMTVQELKCFAEMIQEMRQEKGREISDRCMKDIENAPNPQAAFVRAAVQQF